METFEIHYVNVEELEKIIHVFRETLIQEELFQEVVIQCMGPDSDGPDPITFERQVIQSSQSVTKMTFTREDLITKLEELILNIVTSIGKLEAPSFSYCNKRTWENVGFDERNGLHLIPNIMTTVKFDSPLSLNKFGLTVKILSIIHEMLMNDTYCTKRDLYYQDVQLYGSQTTVDNIVDNISCMLAVPRWHLHVLATSKGCVVGDLQFRNTDGDLVDCTKTDTGVLVPNHVTGITNLTTQAKYVLLVEKDATFQKFVDDSYSQRHSSCIIITGKGFPDVNTRLLLKMIWDTFHLPIFALVDADPHGIEIMATYKYGSRAMGLAVPAVRWLGVLPSDVDKLEIGRDSLINLTEKDIDKAKELLTRPYVIENGPLRNEIELILKRSVKAEIQCLDSLGPHFLMDVYLPNKILSRTWM